MDPYFLHKLALSPLLSPYPREAFKTIANETEKIGEIQLLDFLSDHMLIPLWFETLSKNDAKFLFSEKFIETLKKKAMLLTVNYMAQQHTMEKAAEALTSANIPYVVFKGANIREQIYDNPALRPSADIDILVAKVHKKRAIQALVKTGFSFHPDPENISHEASLIGPNNSIDLHWDIMRPGRTRIDLTDELLATRREYKNYWKFGPEAELLIMLVHPVVTKYLTTPQASLIRVVDILKWIETQEIDWRKVYDLLERSGLKTAAWIHAYWLKLLTGKTLPGNILTQLKPSGLKSIYLRNWIKKTTQPAF